MTGDLRVTKKVLPLPSIGKEAMENRIERERLGKMTTDLFPPPTTTYLFSEERTNERSGYRPSKTISHPLSSRLGKRTDGAAGWKEEDGIPTLLPLSLSSYVGCGCLSRLEGRQRAGER